MASLSVLHLHTSPFRRRSPLSSHSLPSSISLPFSSLSHSDFITIACRHRRIGAPSIGTEIDVETRTFEEEEEEERRVLRVGVVRLRSVGSRSTLPDRCSIIFRVIICVSAVTILIPSSILLLFLRRSVARGFPSLSDFSEHLAASVDIVFPVIHGRFGEDGGLQEILEKSEVPYVGTRSDECRTAFDKLLLPGKSYNFKELLKLHHLYV